MDELVDEMDVDDLFSEFEDSDNDSSYLVQTEYVPFVSYDLNSLSNSNGYESDSTSSLYDFEEEYKNGCKNDYKNELLKALDRLNNAVNKLGEINTNICYSCPREYAYLPCGHFCVCEFCMKKSKNTKPNQCPLCKQPFSECQRIYL